MGDYLANIQAHADASERLGELNIQRSEVRREIEGFEADWQPISIIDESAADTVKIIEYWMDGTAPDDGSRPHYHTGLLALARTLERSPGQVGVISTPKARRWANRFQEYEHHAFLLPEKPTLGISSDVDDRHQVHVAVAAQTKLGSNAGISRRYKADPLVFRTFDLDRIKGIGQKVEDRQHLPPIELTLGTEKIVRWLLTKAEVTDRHELPHVDGLNNVLKFAAERGLVPEKLIQRLGSKAAAQLEVLEPQRLTLNAEYEQTRARIDAYREDGATEDAMRLARALNEDAGEEYYEISDLAKYWRSLAKIVETVTSPSE